jgi:hypothetical protein
MNKKDMAKQLKKAIGRLIYRAPKIKDSNKLYKRNKDKKNNKGDM